MESHKNKLLVTRVGSIQRRIDDQIETKWHYFPRDIQEQEELIAQDDQRTNEERINNLIQNKNTHLPSKSNRQEN